MTNIRAHPKLQPELWKNYTIRFQLQFAKFHFHDGLLLKVYTLLQYFRDAALGNALDRNAPINSHGVFINPMRNRISWMCLNGNLHGSQFVDIKEKVWHSVKIVHSNGQYEFWWDNKQINEYRDDTWLEGEIGFYVRGCDVLLDNIQISGENVPDFQPRAVELDAKKIATTWGSLKRLK